MWYPPSVVVVPSAFESYSATNYDLSARPMWQAIPFDRRFYSDPLYDERKNVLMRSLFQLVRTNNYLQLTSPKLLGWCLYLTTEDRILIQQEGGLLLFLSKHPALTVAGESIYVKPEVNWSRVPMFHGESVCQNCGKSCPVGIKNCSHCGAHLTMSKDNVCVSEDEKQLELLPNSVKEELKVLSIQSDVPKQNININIGCMPNTINTRSIQRNDHRSPAAHPPSSSKRMAPHTRYLWKRVENTKCFKDTAAQASFSLDMELDIQSQVQGHVYTQNDQDHTCKNVKDYHNLDQEVMPPEHYSCRSTSLDDNNTWSYGSRSTEAGFMDSIMATKGSTELSDEPSDTANATAADSTGCFSCLSDSFELAEESGNTHEGLQKKHQSRDEQQIQMINVGSSLKSKRSTSVYVDQIIDACGDFRACFTSTCATEVGQIVHVKNVGTDTDLLAVNHERETQTVETVTSDKTTVTEVYMSDLDVLTEGFIKLKDMEKELEQLKSRQGSSDGDNSRRVCGCDSAQRLRRAELRLLALHFFMCQQHCWKCYFTSPLGESAHHGTEPLPDSVANTLKTLQKDYNKMRRQILAGTSLDDLKPLSVNTENITTAKNYSPASVLGAYVDSFDCPGSGHGVDGEAKELCTMDTDVCEDTEALDDGSRGDKTLVPMHKHPRASPETNPGFIKDPNVSETWFDAEEELGFPIEDGKMEKPNKARKGTDEDDSRNSLLCVSCLPDGVTEELLLWFEKYNATNVCISSFSNNIRVAVVYVMSPSDAKAAVQDLNGRYLQGHAVQVSQLYNLASADLKPNHQSHITAETTGDGLGTNSSSHGVLRCSVDRLTNVCDLPTASGTCVPQHYATMGSFDTIMAQLLERHPNAGRRKIIDALLELRAKHQGILSGLPLRSIVEMTSELLTQASTPTYI